MTTVRCVLCGVVLRRRWWQHGPLAPFPLCPHRDGIACYDRQLAQWWTRGQ